ncbi:MAG: hypothetical protein WC873_01820 [Candidatus Gracilibacteria bacterium]
MAAESGPERGMGVEVSETGRVADDTVQISRRNLALGVAALFTTYVVGVPGAYLWHKSGEKAKEAEVYSNFLECIKRAEETLREARNFLGGVGGGGASYSELLDQIYRVETAFRMRRDELENDEKICSDMATIISFSQGLARLTDEATELNRSAKELTRMDAEGCRYGF